MLSATEVAKHNTRESCWIIVKQQVYDVTEFLDQHPGGSAIILKYAGRDATEEYEPIHPPNALEDNLSVEKRLGEIDLSTLKDLPKADVKSVGKDASKKADEKVPLSQIISMRDFEDSARQSLTRKAWAYYSSGATDETTLALNRTSFSQIIFKPRVLVDVSVASTSTSVLAGSIPVSLPVFICPTGMAKLSHPRGEECFAEGAGRTGNVFMISSNASAGLDQIIQARTKPSQPFFFQLYVNRDRSKAEALVKKVSSYSNVKAIVMTVDAPTAGKREADEKVKAEVVLDLGVAGGKGSSPDSKGGGIGRAMGGYIDPSLAWSDIAWLRSLTNLPIGIKGIQTVADVLKAKAYGVDIIYLSNHGGRALDSAPPALHVLMELRKYYPSVLDDGKGEIWIDGGIRRGTDVVKALCLGAKYVGMGRPFMYALMYGTEGVEQVFEIIKDEMETTMKLLGVTSIDQLGPHLLNTKALEQFINDPEPLLPRSKL